MTSPNMNWNDPFRVEVKGFDFNFLQTFLQNSFGTYDTFIQAVSLEKDDVEKRVEKLNATTSGIRGAMCFVSILQNRHPIVDHLGSGKKGRRERERERRSVGFTGDYNGGLTSSFNNRRQLNGAGKTIRLLNFCTVIEMFANLTTVSAALGCFESRCDKASSVPVPNSASMRESAWTNAIANVKRNICRK